ncbi:MAG: GNAT family N-acetyltransferase, partial [Eubacteriales bacterium]|nr:GNAT family N-acetyltransferase [Eubacteriales bacterium]
MRNDWVRGFIRMGRRGEAMFTDGELALRPREYAGHSRVIGSEHTFVFDVVECNSGRTVGELALRIGDSAEQFYLGHIGYHIDPPFRGHAYASKACRLCVTLMKTFGMGSAVITTDPGNLPSIRTCLRLGCLLETTVAVPQKVRDKLDISPEKNRYIWIL